MDLSILVEEVEGLPVLVLLGEVDRGTATALGHHLSQALAQTPPAVVLDLSCLRFMDSAGVHAVLDTQQSVEAYGGRLAVATGPGHVRDIFLLTGAPLSVALHRTREEAVAGLAGRVLEPR